MLFKSQIFTQVSGSVGGLTFSHNKGGLYTRSRAIPTNPNTAPQTAARNAMASLVALWTETLTQAERDGWATYALNTPVVNVFGDSKNITGQQMYIRSNQPRVRSGATRIDSAPTIFDLGTFTTPTFVVSAASPSDLVITFTAGDSWVGANDAHLIVLISRGQNQSINFFKSPFQFADNIDGSASSPPPSPTTITSPFVYVIGQKVFASIRASQADGRLSNRQFINTIVIA